MGEATDEELIRHWHVLRNKRAFAILFMRYREYVYRTSFGMLGNMPAAKDATQMVFEKLILRSVQFKGASFKSWVTKIIRNTCIDYLHSNRAQTKNQQANLDEMVREFSEPFYPQPEFECAQQACAWRHKKLWQALDKLSARQREVIVLHHISQLDFAQVGQTLGCSENNARVTHHHGMKNLLKIIGEQAQQDE